MFLRQVGNFILDTIFPIECIGCKKQGEWLCGLCAGRIPIEEQNECMVCKTSGGAGRTCFICRREIPLARLIRVFPYDAIIVKRSLQLIKYNYVKNLLDSLVIAAMPYWLGALEQSDIDPRALAFMPVPLHPRRQRERGFNQSEIIARAVAQACGGSYANALTRGRFTIPQVDLDEEDRKRNIKGAFVCPDDAPVKDKYVVIVDDVATTGSTLAECAYALLGAGAKKIWGLTLAKG